MEFIREAVPGIYKEKSTGIEIENPDFILEGDLHVKDSGTIEDVVKAGFNPDDWLM